jgi:DNA primase
MGSIPQNTIEQVAAANDIVEVIGSYFPLKRAGATFKALCPFHQEKSPSFTVNPGRQIFKCFGCGVGGSVFKFVELYEHLTFPEAVKKLAARAGIPVIEERSFSSADDRQHDLRRVLLQLHAEAADWFHQNLLKRDWAAPAREYLKNRGIDRNIAAAWQIGYAPNEWQAFTDWARERGYTPAVVAQSGLVSQKEDEPGVEHRHYDRFRGRVMFPIHNDVGEVIAFSGRILDPAASPAKYVNSPETPLFRKGNVLFGLHKSKRALIDAKVAIVCEGQLDLITLFENGITNVVAPQGTAFTEQQARTLARLVEQVVLCFDADAAGEKAAERSLEALLQNDLLVRIAEMPPGEDPDSIVRTRGKAEFQQRIANAREFFDYWIETQTAAADLHSLGGKLQLARRLAETVGKVHDPIMRSEVATKVATRIGVPTAEFEALLPKSSNQRYASSSVAPAHPAQQAAIAPRHEVAMLCLLALRDPAAREFLLEEHWDEVLAQTPDSEMLSRILGADLRADDPASVNAFISTLAPEEEALVAGWLLQRMPPNPATVAREWWTGLKQAAVRRQLQIAEGRMKIPQLSAGEMTKLQKQVVDLTAQLRQLHAFSSARVLDR